MANHSFKVAMIGGGLNSAVGRTHEIALKLDNEFRLVAGCFSRCADINQATADAYRIESGRVYDTADALISAEYKNIDAVVLATPIDSHSRFIHAALDSGLTVICDKPLLANVSEADKLLSRLSVNSLKVFSIFNYTGYPAVREIRKRIRQGDVGTVFKIMAEMPQDSYLRLNNSGKVSAIQPWRLIDGDIPCLSLDLFVHVHSLVNFMVGGVPVCVDARSRSVSGVADGLIDDVDALIGYDNGMFLNAWYGKAALGYRNGLRLRIFGSKGSFEWLQELPEEIRYSDRLGDRYLLDRISSTAEITQELRYNRFKAGHPAGFIEAFSNYYSDIARAMRDGVLNEYTLSLGVAVEGIKVCNAIHQSSEFRREVAVDL
ncbi:Gfo/Idh/MocA family oxidoreductase [Uliginosibacterium sediminicola]|uniref:Gfo/Idh/MocA family oxidoreductase n=1 Tax=Uliginosibacterium sediminicola TaxID=2024550 RepID=A0ABU9Z2P0_9RHOO